MEASQVFATGGASGVIGIVLYLVYRFFFSKHRIVSRCCGKEFSLEVDSSTPRINNINSLVDEPKATSNEGGCAREREGRSQSPEVRDASTVHRSEEEQGEPHQVKRESVPEGRVQEGPASTSNTD